MNPREEILEEAKRIVTSDRNSQYGDPEDNFGRIAKLWTVQLERKLAPGVVIEPGDVARLMIHVKLAREVNAPARDNLLDAIGYAACGYDADVAAGRIVPSGVDPVGEKAERVADIVEEVHRDVLAESIVVVEHKEGGWRYQCPRCPHAFRTTTFAPENGMRLHCAGCKRTSRVVVG